MIYREKKRKPYKVININKILWETKSLGWMGSYNRANQQPNQATEYVCRFVNEFHHIHQISIVRLDARKHTEFVT
jgi:hypothetical protein